jgi:hypothetical protein
MKTKTLTITNRDIRNRLIRKMKCNFDEINVLCGEKTVIVTFTGRAAKESEELIQDESSLWYGIDLAAEGKATLVKDHCSINRLIEWAYDKEISVIESKILNPINRETINILEEITKQIYIELVIEDVAEVAN